MRACDGISRRQLLQAGGAGLLGLSLPRVLAAEELRPPRLPNPGGRQRKRRARSVIFLFLFGGPSQLETFDLKPEAPSSIRGPFKPIRSRTPGLLISERLPRLAAISDKYCVIRTMTHDFNDHSGGAHYIQTGHRWQVPVGGGFNPTPNDWPSIGSVVEYAAQRRSGGRNGDLPAYVVMPNTLGRLQEAGQYLRPGEHAGWLGQAYNPLTTSIEKRNLVDNPYWRDCTDEELTFQVGGLAAQKEVRLDRLQRRRSLLQQFDQARRALEHDPAIESYDRFQRRALGLVCSERTRRALDIRAEPAALRDRYGRHLFGQSCLMARRLVEAGVRFVTVHYDACDGYSWDSHTHSDDVRDHLLPTTDQAAAALLQDLDERGLLAETLVVMMGEMGRTPQANPRWGRGHWSTLFPALLAGAGVRGGVCHGASDGEAAYPTENPVRPEDLAATLYQALGLDPEMEVVNREGRPVRLIDGGRPIPALFG
jgi:hypothetical protein